MNVGDHVYLDDPSGRHHGKITTRASTGMCTVKWDSGISERVHESELKAVEVADHEAIRVGPGSDWNPDSYADDDPKSPGWRDRLASLWDSRPGK